MGDRSKRAKVAELSVNPPEALAKAAYKVQIKKETEVGYRAVKLSAENNNIKLPTKMDPGEALSLKIQMKSIRLSGIAQCNKILKSIQLFPLSWKKSRSSYHQIYPLQKLVLPVLFRVYWTTLSTE